MIGPIDVNGDTLITYRYNAWGVQTGYTLGRANADIFYNCNALKYRGYMSTGQDFLGFNQIQLLS